MHVYPWLLCASWQIPWFRHWWYEHTSHVPKSFLSTESFIKLYVRLSDLKPLTQPENVGGGGIVNYLVRIPLGKTTCFDVGWRLTNESGLETDVFVYRLEVWYTADVQKLSQIHSLVRAGAGSSVRAAFVDIHTTVILHPFQPGGMPFV